MQVDMIEHASIIESDLIEQFIDYIDELIFTSEDEDDTEESRECALAILADYDMSAVQELREMIVHTGSGATFISEVYFDQYVTDELHGFDVNMTEFVREYFDYDRYCDEARSEYTSFEYDGTTYYTSA
jgi:hypothetical protein